MFYIWLYWQMFPDELWWDTLQGLKNLKKYTAYVGRLHDANEILHIIAELEDLSLKSHYNGYTILYDGDRWYYEDTGKPTVGSERSCGYCSKEKTKQGHDGCLGTLPNVVNACCGHGVECNAYVMFLDGSRISGSEAIAWQKRNVGMFGGS